MLAVLKHLKITLIEKYALGSMCEVCFRDHGIP